MDDLLYNALLKYFTRLSHFGQTTDAELRKIIFYCFIDELVKTPSVVITPDEYAELEKALYAIYGTTCLISYPDYCDDVLYLHLGKANIEDVDDMDDKIAEELLSRVENLETAVSTLESLDYALETNVP